MARMKLDPDAPAYPAESDYDDQPRFATGLTVRQDFAKDMAKGLLAGDPKCLWEPQALAKRACQFADALVDELSKET
jgi:hypothetical protein